MQICPVCFWEDAPGEAPWNSSNGVSLLEAQMNFVEFGASEREFLDAVRPATSDEPLDPAWLNFEDQAEAIIQLIEASFADVTLGEGMTIHQREVVDDRGSQKEFDDARQWDTEQRWQDIRDSKIMHLGTTLTFLDDESIRYHLPAFMRCVLRQWLEAKKINHEMILHSLADGPKSPDYYADAFTLLNPGQKQATAAFLKFLSLTDFRYGDEAERGLRRGWADFLHTPTPIPFFP